MTDTSTQQLLFVSNEKLLDELKRRIDDGWMPTDSSYLADLVMSLVNAQTEVEAELARQCEPLLEVAPPVEAKPQLESGMLEIYDWLRGQGYSDTAATSFIDHLPEGSSENVG